MAAGCRSHVVGVLLVRGGRAADETERTLHVSGQRLDAGTQDASCWSHRLTAGHYNFKGQCLATLEPSAGMCTGVCKVWKSFDGSVTKTAADIGRGTRVCLLHQRLSFYVVMKCVHASLHERH